MRRTARVALTALLAALVIEVAAALFTAQLEARGELYRAQTTEGYDAYLSARDPILGWPPAQPKRTYSRFAACAAVFGSTLSAGARLGPNAAYPALIEQQLGCYVANYSVESYGTDQAFLRYRDVEHENAPVVVLAHDSASLARNVSQFRGYLDGTPFGLKPRFGLGHDGTLGLFKLPTPSARDYARLAAGEAGPLPQEYWRTPPMRRFPYTGSALAWLRGKRLGAELHDEAALRALYGFDHESDVATLTLVIMERFAITARERGQKPLVAIIPDAGSMRALREGRGLPYAAFERELRKRKVEVVRVAETLAEGGTEGLHASDGSLSEAGRVAVASLIATEIVRPREPAPER